METKENIDILAPVLSRPPSISGSINQVLNAIEKLYQEALVHYQDSNFEVAQSKLKSLLKMTPVAHFSLNPFLKITECASWIISSIHLLAKIHLVEDLSCGNHGANNYAKAACMLQYCAKFAAKYDPCHYDDRIHINFLQEAYRVESLFLSSCHRQNHKSQSLQDDTLLYQERIDIYKAKLEQIRLYISSKLYEINTLNLSQISQRAKMTEDLYQESMEFFINNARSRNQHQGFLQLLIHDCQNQLAHPPCKYSIIGLGSLAGGKMTPWSDIEFAILIQKDNQEHKEYFRNLTILLHIAIINLGETPLRSLGISVLNDFRSNNKEDDWFWDDLTMSGLKFDGPDHHACKTPLGRQGGYLVSDGNLAILKPDFELILTPKQMAELQKEVNNRNIVSFETDPRLVLALRSTILIDGDQGLLDLYRKEMVKIASSSIVKSRSIEKLKEDIENFQVKLGDEEEGRLIEVKKDIFRISDRIIEDLCIYHQIIPDIGSSSLSAWQAIDKMSAHRTRSSSKTCILSIDGADNLKSSLSIACELRLRTYAHNQGQIELMYIYEPQITDSKIDRQSLIKETFYINDTAILHHFYSVMLETQKLLREFCNNHISQMSDLNLINSPLIDRSDYTKAMIHSRFLEYDKALAYMERAKTEYCKNISFLTDLYLLYHKTGMNGKAISIMNDYIMRQPEEGEPELELARSYNDLASSHQVNGDLELASMYYHKSLAIYSNLSNINEYNAISLSVTASIARTYSNLASLLLKQGDYEDSIIKSQAALEMKLLVYLNHPDHPSIAKSYSNLAAGFQGANDHEKAFVYYNQSLAICIKAYKNYPNHPSIAKLYSNLGSLSYVNRDYEVAIGYYNKSLLIYTNSYQHYPHHPSIASVLYDLARSYFKVSDYCNSWISCQKSIEISVSLHQSDINHQDIARCNKLCCKLIQQHPSLSTISLDNVDSLSYLSSISRQNSLQDSQKPLCSEFLSQEAKSQITWAKIEKEIFAECSTNPPSEMIVSNIIGQTEDSS